MRVPRPGSDSTSSVPPSSLDSLRHSQQGRGVRAWRPAPGWQPHQSPRRRRGRPTPGRSRSGSARSRRAVPRRAARRSSALPAPRESRRWPVRERAASRTGGRRPAPRSRSAAGAARRASAGSLPGRGVSSMVGRNSSARLRTCSPACCRSVAHSSSRGRAACPARPRAAWRCRVMVARIWPNSSCNSRARWRRSSSWTSSNRRERCCKRSADSRSAFWSRTRSVTSSLTITAPTINPSALRMGAAEF